jgi:hypothetical protein
MTRSVHLLPDLYICGFERDLRVMEVWRCCGVEVWRCCSVEVWRCCGVEVWRWWRCCGVEGVTAWSFGWRGEGEENEEKENEMRERLDWEVGIWGWVR